MKTEKPTITAMQKIMGLFKHFLPKLYAGPCSPQQEATFINLLITEITLLKQELRRSQIDMEAGAFRSLIQATLHELMVLTGSLVAFVDAQELCVPTRPASRVCRNSYLKVNDLINSISRQYADCVLKDTYVPEQFRVITAYELFHGLAAVVDSLWAQGADQVLIDVVMWPFSDCATTSTDVTLERLNYLKLLKLQLPRMVQEVAEMDAPIGLVMQIMFCGLNFNSPTAVQYCVKQIHDMMETLDSVEERLDFLDDTRIRLSLMPPLKEGLALQPELPRLMDQLCKWLDKEDDRLSRALQAATAEPESHPQPTPKGVVQMPIGMPNEHHALFMKIQIKAGGYACSERQAMEIIPQIFCTSDGSTIGKTAYRTSFKRIEEASVRGVLAFCERCVDILKTDYGPWL
jgi:hypothetical protein